MLVLWNILKIHVCKKNLNGGVTDVLKPRAELTPESMCHYDPAVRISGTLIILSHQRFSLSSLSYHLSTFTGIL